MYRQLALLFCLFSVLAAAGCDTGQTPSAVQKELDHIRFQLKWQHSGQFAGIYTAREEGFYADEHLQVTLIEGGPAVDQVEQLMNGAADIAQVPAESLFLKNDQPDKMVAVAVIFQQSPLVFAVKADSQISRPEDFPGSVVAAGDLYQSGFLEGIVQFNAFMRLRGLDPASVRLVPYDWDFASFIEGSADITPTYMTSGALKLKHQGVAIREIWPGDYGLEYYADTIVVRQSFINEKRDILLRLLRATLEGWQFAIAHSDKALEYTYRYVDESNRAMQADILEMQTPLIHTGSSPIGWMDKRVWQSMHDILLDENLLNEPFEDIGVLINKQFLREIYPTKDQ